MSRLFSLFLIALISLLPNTIHSQETVQIIILPFEVHAMEDLSYLKAEIPGLIKKQLKVFRAKLDEASKAPEPDAP